MSSQRRATRIETSLVIVIFILRVFKYVVSRKLFWNRIEVVQFESHEVRFDIGFVLKLFLY